MNFTNCNTIFNGNYCTDCGEKKFDIDDLSLTHFVEEIFESFIHFSTANFYAQLKHSLLNQDLLSLDVFDTSFGFLASL